MEDCKRSSLAENTLEGSHAESVPASGGHAVQASSRWTILLAEVTIVLTAMAAYSNSFQCPFNFDDLQDIVANSSIRHLWPIRDVFVVQYDGRSVLHGRPVVNLSLALNHATGGLEPLDYHVTNLLVHVLAGLTLFGIVRRTLLLPSLCGRFTAAATSLALAAALIWTLHPLQTGAVTYIIQRYESMMGLFYLLALYATVRCGTSAHPRRWAVAAVTATLLSLGCKEVAVSIPLCILLYDRAFLAGSFWGAWRQRWGMYVGLAAAWAAFAVLFMLSYSRATWAGYGLPVSWIEYARSQFGVILHYLRLSFWPFPLVLDYGWPVARTVGEILPGAVVIGGLAAATAYALIRWPKWGFLGAWFFLILAPTSSVLPLLDLAFEHRMYLPLATVAVGVVVGGWVAGQWLARHAKIPLLVLQVLGGALVLLAGLALGILTFHRNKDYRSELSIWEDTAAKMPGNDRPYFNLGAAMGSRGQFDEAITQYRKALEINPNFAEAYNNLGAALASRGQFDEAIASCRKALAIEPNNADFYSNLGMALAGAGRMDDAVAEYRMAVELNPGEAKSHYNLGNALVNCQRIDEAIAQYEMALQIEPNFVAAHNNFGTLLARIGRFDEAIAQYEKSLQIKPDSAKTHNNLGLALMECGRFDEATSHFQRALELKPDYTDAHNNLGIAQSRREEILKSLAGRRESLRAAR